MEGSTAKNSEENSAEQGDHYEVGTCVIEDRPLHDKPQGLTAEDGMGSGIEK